MTEEEKQEFLDLLESLPAGSRSALLDTLRRMPAGGTLRYWNPALGSASAEDAREMADAIEEAFEQVGTDARPVGH